jgi:signal transduction histidine kinase
MAQQNGNWRKLYCAALETKNPDEYKTAPPWTGRRELPNVQGRSRLEPTTRRFMLVVAVGVGVVSFLATELMHYLLVPDLGRNPERFLAEGVSALLVSCLTARLVQIARERQRLTVARMQVIAEMNHHIRNALSPISLSLDSTADQQLNRVISEAVDRIDWALREILPREVPLREGQRHELGYFQTYFQTHFQAKKRSSYQ